MSREFQHKTHSGYSKPHSLYYERAFAASTLITGAGPFTVTQDGDVIAQDKSRRRALDVLFRTLRDGDIGPVYRVRDGGGDVVYAVRETADATYKIIDTNGNAHADEYWSWVVATYPEFHPRFAGAYVCKEIAGTNTLSQHSYGNAVDVFFDSTAHQEAVFNDIRAGKCPVAVAHAISLQRIWEPPNDTHAYGGDTHYHLHADFIPQYSGGCGVRG